MTSQNRDPREGLRIRVLPKYHMASKQIGTSDRQGPHKPNQKFSAKLFRSAMSSVSLHL